MIDFEKIAQTEIPHMRNGEGNVKANTFTDGKVKLMRLTLEQGVSIGLHRHETNLEVVYVLSGEASCLLQGREEVVPAGSVHYCPKGCEHTIMNKRSEPLVLLAIIPELA